MKIMLNGQKYVTSATTYFELQNQVEGETVLVVEGFQLKEDQPIIEESEVFLIPKYRLPPKEQLEGMMAARHTPRIHQQLTKSKVLIIGLGGLGSNIAVQLARLGVGHLRLVDFDTVEASNLNRQHYGIRHLGMKKTEALKEQIEEINPFITVEVVDLQCGREELTRLAQGMSVICEAVDGPQTKAALIEEALLSTKLPIVAASGMAGFANGNLIRTRKLRDRLYLAGDGQSAAELGQGLMAPRVAICAGHQANMILQLLIGEEDINE